MTRAMERYATYAGNVALWRAISRISRFIAEIPPDTLHEVVRKPAAKQSSYDRFNNASHEAFDQTGYALGQRVRHPKFGEGTCSIMKGWPSVFKLTSITWGANGWWLPLDWIRFSKCKVDQKCILQLCL